MHSGHRLILICVHCQNKAWILTAIWVKWRPLETNKTVKLDSSLFGITELLDWTRVNRSEPDWEKEKEPGMVLKRLLLELLLEHY